MKGFSTQHHSYFCRHEPLQAGFPAYSMAFECSTSSPPLPMVMQQLQEGFPRSFGAESASAAGGGDKGRRMVSVEVSLGSAQEMDGSGGKMVSRKNKRRNANVAGEKGIREGRGHGVVVDMDDAKVEEEAAGYVHVRARRGQATDSHSVAERLRREKISEKMKMLQSLVPGCDKLTGKALLDEIISYVQSLQRQVEFLSMRLATLNPVMVYELGLDIGNMCHPNAPQVVKMAPHELVERMGQGAAATASLAEAQAATGLAQDGAGPVMQQVPRQQEEELNHFFFFFEHTRAPRRLFHSQLSYMRQQ